MWYDCVNNKPGAREVDYRKALREIESSIDTAERFWSVFNHVLLPSEVRPPPRAV
jgi:hypothetical protein